MWADTVALLQVDFVQHAVVAALLLGLLSGVMAPFVVIRQMAFAVHGTSELALMGAAAALFFGLNLSVGAVVGSVVAALVLALLGLKEQDSAVGAVMAFGMGLSVLFIHLYPGKSTNAFALLTGQIVGVGQDRLVLLSAVTVIVLVTIALIWRPLLFASADPILAASAGVPIRRYAVIFAILVGLTSAQSVQIVGALLVMALLITPGAAAVQVARRPLTIVLLSTVFALVSAVGGVIASLAPGLPVSVLVTSISFAIYCACRFIGMVQKRQLTASNKPEPSCHC